MPAWMTSLLRLEVSCPKRGFHAQTRFQAACRVIQAGVYHLAVAARGFLPDAGVLLKHDNAAARAAPGKLPRNCQPDNSRADDQRIESVHR